MEIRRLAIVLLIAVPLAAVGCKSSSGSKDDGSLTDEKSRVPGFFHEIPANSFYVYAGLEPIPKGIVKSQLEGTDQSFLGNFLELVREEGGNDPFSKVLAAVLAELEGNFSPKGLRELGFSLEPYTALYGVGGAPLFRMSLGDPEAFESMLNRVETKADVDVRMKESEGTKYRLYEREGVHVPVVIRDGAVVGGIYPKEASDVLLPYVLGQKEPDESLADSGTIRELVDNYDYEPYAVAYADVRGFVRTFTGVRKPDAPTKAVMRANGEQVEEASEICAEEIRAVTDKAPRIVFGTTKFDTEEFEYELGVELDEELGREVGGLTNPVPGVETDLFEDALLAIGVGVDVDRWTSMTRNHARAITENPYECEKLKELNEWARQYKNQPIPTVVSQIKGAAFILKKAAFSGRQPKPDELHALGLVRMNNPQTLIGRLQTVIPGLADIEIKDDGVPVPLKKLANRMPYGEAPHVALRDDVLGFSVGVGMQDSMGAVLEDPTSAATNTAVAVSYDLDKARAALPDWVVESSAENLGEEFLPTVLTGSGQFRLLFRNSGVFFVTRGKHESGGSGESDGGAEASTVPPRERSDGSGTERAAAE